MLWLRRLLNIFRNDQLHNDLNDELSFHLEMAVRDRMNQGLPQSEARQEAHLKFGNRTLQQERTRDANVLTWLDGLWRDARYALRGLRRRPGFVATALASLALGIGANSAIFSVVDSVLLKPLPVPNAHQLVALKEFKSMRPSGGNPARRNDWRIQVEAFQSAAAWYGENVVYSEAGEPRRLSMLRTFGSVTETLAVAPAIGRPFTPQEERGQGQSVAMLSQASWQRLFGGDPRIVGRTLKLSGAPFTVIGVLPARLTYPEDVDVWPPGPLEVQKASRKAGLLGVNVGFDGAEWLEVTGVVGDLRQEPGRAAMPEVFADMRTLYWPMASYVLRAEGDPAALITAVREQIRALDPEFIPGPIQTLEDGLGRTIASQRTRAGMLGGFAFIALLLLCIGVYGLLSADVARCRQEIGIRIALGARPSDVLAVTLARGLRLVAVGLAIGLAGALALSGSLSVLLYGVRPTDPAVYVAAALVAAAAAALACYLPARRAYRLDPLAALRHE